MHTILESLENKMQSIELSFSKKPILIGGMAMEYYGIRKSGADIDFVVCDEDYQLFASAMPDKRKDIYGDLGIVIETFEIWRSIALLDYDFYLKDAVDEGNVFIISLDRLLLTRVNAMEVEKYMNDLKLIKQYYYNKFRNQSFLVESERHILSYERNHGIVFGGEYKDNNI